MSTLKRCKTLLIALAASVLVGCNAEEADTGPATASISGYNSTDDYIHRFYINDIQGNNSRAYGGGGKFVWCISYPHEWWPDLTATGRWSTSVSTNKPFTGVTWHEDEGRLSTTTRLEDV